MLTIWQHLKPILEWAGYIVGGLVALFIILDAISIWAWKLKWAWLVPKDKLPEILLKRHDDYWWILKRIPRRWTAFMYGRGDPIQLIGNNPKDHHQDVPEKGKWCVSWPFHFVFNINEFLIAFGIRRDYIDDYWDIRIEAAHRYK